MIYDDLHTIPTIYHLFLWFFPGLEAADPRDPGDPG